MTWQEKMRQGMELMINACDEADSCNDCPFQKYCQALEENSIPFWCLDW